MTTIREMKVRAVRVQMREPHRTASGVITESPLVLIDAITEDGVTGHGIVFTYSAAALGPVAQLAANLEELVKGQELAPAAITQALAKRFRLLGTQGLVGMALAGIDMALWDALAHVHGVSLARLLGGTPKPIPAYAAIGYDGAGESARCAGEWVRKGFRAMKAKIGYPELREDVQVVGAIRREVGPGISIMVDYNQSLTPAEAVARIEALEEFDLTWVEEPVLANDFEGHAFVARAVRTPIQCGENWWGPLEMRYAIAAGASDYVMPEVMKIGGVTGWRAAAALAETHSMRVSNHLWPEVSVQLLSTTPMMHWLEYSDWWNPILTAPLELERGFALPADRPGSGIEWNEKAVSECLA